MKRLTKRSILFILIFIHGLMIFQPILILYAQKSIKVLQQELLKTNAIETLIFKTNEFKLLQFIEPHEFYFNDFLYDVKTIIHKKNEVIVKAIKDRKETNLLSFLKKKNEKKHDKIKNLIHFFLLTYTPLTLQIFAFFFNQLKPIGSIYICNLYNSFLFEMFIPPRL